MLTKRVIITLLLGIACALVSVGWLEHSIGSQQGKQGKVVPAKDDQLVKLRIERLEAAQRAYKAAQKVAKGQPFSDLLYQISVRWLHAELDLSNTKEKRVNAYNSHLLRMQTWQGAYAGKAPDNPILSVLECFEKEANYWLTRERQQDQ